MVKNYRANSKVMLELHFAALGVRCLLFEYYRIQSRDIGSLGEIANIWAMKTTHKFQWIVALTIFNCKYESCAKKCKT